MKKLISLLTAIISFAFLANIAIGETPKEKVFHQVFTDVKYNETDYDYTDYYYAIKFLKEQGVVSGYEDGSFKPHKTINRAEFLKIVQESNMEEGIDSKYKSQKCFKDVEANQWYTEYVCYAKANGIIQGYKDGTFNPSQEVTLVEALKMTLKVFFYKYDDTDPWYKGVVEVASELNIIPLYVTGFTHKLTRGEMAEIATRIKKYETADLEAYLKLSIGFETTIKTTYEVLLALEDTSSFCSKEPIMTDIGSLEYPIATQYANMGSYLGQLLTADNCEDKTRMKNIFGVSSGAGLQTTFTLGSSLELKEKGPSSGLFSTLEDIGYECTEVGSLSPDDTDCSSWELTEEVDVNKLFNLKPYADEIESGDCVNCG